MIAIIQRVTEASVTVDGKCVGECGVGFLVLLGVARGDELLDAKLLSDKIFKLRIFEDAQGKMNRSLADVNGSVLVVPNFTLLASYRHGNRPDFLASEEPQKAKELFLAFCDMLSENIPVSRGIFGADMKVSLVNDGPITIPMNSAVLRESKNTQNR